MYPKWGEKDCCDTNMYDDCDYTSMKYMPKMHKMDYDMCCDMPKTHKMDYECCDMPKMHKMGYDCCDMPKMTCKTEKKCVKTYKCIYKLYKTCHYRLYKVCPRCGHEYDYHHHRGMCPKCD